MKSSVRLPAGLSNAGANGKGDFLAWYLLLLVVLLLIAWIPEAIQPGFYYDDDVRHIALPNVFEIGYRLRSGEFPWITLRSWFAGNLVGEGLFGLFNPVNLLLYTLSSYFVNLYDAAFCFAASYIVLTGFGVFFFSRALGLSAAFALLAAATFCGSNFNLYWHASAWWIVLAGNCWMIWACWAWLKFIESGRGGFALVVLSALTLCSAYAQAVIGVTFFVLVWSLSNWRQFTSRTFVGKFMLLSACCIGTGLPTAIPMIKLLAMSGRSDWPIRTGALIVGSFDNLFAMSWPSFMSQTNTYFGNAAYLPHVFLGWFVAPALLLLFRAHNRALMSRADRNLIGLAGLLFVLTLGPEQFFFLRWPLRFLPYSQLFAVIAACRVLQLAPRWDSNDRIIWGAYWLLGLTVCTLSNPFGFVQYMSFALLCGLGTVALFVYGKNERNSTSIILLVGVVILTLTHLNWERNANLRLWSAPIRNNEPSAFAPVSTLGNYGNSRLLLTDRIFLGDNDSNPYVTGAIGLWEKGRMLNGYTPLGVREYEQILGFDAWSVSRRGKDSASAYFAPDMETGMPLFRLLRISEIRVAGKRMLSYFAAAANSEWRKFSTDGVGVIYRYDGKPYALPGTLSWMSPNLSLSATSYSFHDLEEGGMVANASSIPGKMIFARAFYPGYRARIGKLDLPVQRQAGFATTVMIPPATSGELHLWFEPPGIRWTLPVALASFLLALVVSMFDRRHSTQRIAGNA